jgi:hypothetical protein
VSRIIGRAKRWLLHWQWSGVAVGVGVTLLAISIAVFSHLSQSVTNGLIT